MAVVEMVNPVAEAPTTRAKLAPRVDRLEGKTVGFRIMWDSFQEYMDRFEELLKDRYHPKAVVMLDKKWSASRSLAQMRTKGAAEKEFEDWAKQIDYAILGLAA